MRGKSTRKHTGGLVLPEIVGVPVTKGSHFVKFDSQFCQSLTLRQSVSDFTTVGVKFDSELESETGGVRLYDSRCVSEQVALLLHPDDQTIFTSFPGAATAALAATENR
jgi:hypothetical protein